MRSGLRFALQAALVALVSWFAGVTLARQWGELQSLGRALHPRWGYVVASALVVLLSYAVLIQTWRRTVVAWGERLSFADGARIWFVSNLGRYVPGKVWQIGAMGALAQRQGVSPVAAVGSALVVSLVNVLAGFAVVGATGADSLQLGTAARLALGVLTSGVLLAPWLLPLITRAAARISGRDIATPRLPASAVWIAAAGCVVAWLLYGLAFRLLSRGLLPLVGGNAADATAVFTGSYLVGFLVLFAPGGIGAREVAMYLALQRTGIAEGADATLLVVASRLWLTVLELLPGLLFLGWARPTPPPAPPVPPTDS